jgi:hypothetical protein
LTRCVFPAATRLDTEAFSQCIKLQYIDLPVATDIGMTAFYNDEDLDALILRNTEAVCGLYNTGVFYNTGISKGTGHIYVPRTMVDSYKAATNWSNFSSQIRAIEDYPEITGGA